MLWTHRRSGLQRGIKIRIGASPGGREHAGSMWNIAMLSVVEAFDIEGASS